ncbi:MAG: hypothetical protein H7249_14130 [Chitinophagaceae bacterium]|nr:hypothetical protein [Oligoflexus sp.]
MSTFRRETGEEFSSSQNQTVEVDINFPRFLEEFENLELSEADLLLKTLARIELMTWNDVYRSSTKSPGDKRGINFEPLDKNTEGGPRIATIRVTGKFRARVCREGRKMRLISLHPDHDSAYSEGVDSKFQ